MKYKVGDIVQIRKDLNKKIKSPHGVIADMLVYKGKKTVIVSMNDNSYALECDNCFWSWDDNMLEDIREVRRKKLEKLYEIL